MKKLIPGLDFSARRMGARVGLSYEDLKLLLLQNSLKRGEDWDLAADDDIALTAATVYRVLACLTAPPSACNLKRWVLQSPHARRCAYLLHGRGRAFY